jgi:hypothetical protein
MAKVVVEPAKSHPSSRVVLQLWPVFLALLEFCYLIGVGMKLEIHSKRDHWEMIPEKTVHLLTGSDSVEMVESSSNQTVALNSAEKVGMNSVETVALNSAEKVEMNSVERVEMNLAKTVEMNSAQTVEMNSAEMAVMLMVAVSGAIHNHTGQEEYSGQELLSCVCMVFS